MKNIYINKEILENIDIDKILNQLEFGISNRASSHTPATQDEAEQRALKQ